MNFVRQKKSIRQDKVCFVTQPLQKLHLRWQMEKNIRCEAGQFVPQITSVHFSHVFVVYFKQVHLNDWLCPVWLYHSLIVNVVYIKWSVFSIAHSFYWQTCVICSGCERKRSGGGGSVVSARYFWVTLNSKPISSSPLTSRCFPVMLWAVPLLRFVWLRRLLLIWSRQVRIKSLC